MLGERGLFALVNQLGRDNQVRLGERLLTAIDSRRGPSDATDDQTLIVIQRNRMPLPRHSLLRTAQTLAKLIGLSRI